MKFECRIISNYPAFKKEMCASATRAHISKDIRMRDDGNCFPFQVKIHY